MANLRGVREFVTIARTASLRRAAAALELSPAAVSKSLARLEERLGVVLVERGPRGATLTSHGHAYLSHASEALQALQRGEDAIASTQGIVRGALRVSFSAVLVDRLTPMLAAFASEYPELTLELHVGDRRVRLGREDMDLVLRIGLEESETTLRAQRMRTLRWVTVAAPEYIARRGLPQTPAELAGHVLWMYRRPNGRSTEWQLPRGFDTESATVHRIDDGPALLRAALSGHGIVQGFDLMVDPHIAAGRLVKVFDKRPRAPALYALTQESRSRLPAIEALTRHLRRSFA